jgi:hypothetical protein
MREDCGPASSFTSSCKVGKGDGEGAIVDDGVAAIGGGEMGAAKVGDAVGEAVGGVKVCVGVGDGSLVASGVFVMTPGGTVQVGVGVNVGREALVEVRVEVGDCEMAEVAVAVGP